MTLRKVKTGLLSALRAPIVMPAAGFIAPVCDLCQKPLDSEEMVETWRTGARVLGKHHGQEELASFELGTEQWEPEDLSRAMRGHKWFAPVEREAQ